MFGTDISFKEQTMKKEKTMKKAFILAIAIAAVMATVLGCKGKKETGAPEGFVRINGGTFTMGSPANEAGRKDDEVQHQVTVSSFYMGKYEVTQKEWTAVMGSNPSSFQGDNLPVEMVSWYDALVFCNTLSISEGLTPAYSINGKTNPNDWGTVPTSRDATWNAVTIVANSNGYRLPTEAQWEYACRAGTTTAYHTGNTISDNTGWYSANSGSKTHEVGKKAANAWNLYDMHGNVFEWCWDWYDSYSSGAQTDPTGASSGDYRVIRGGSWNYSAEDIRSAYRINTDPSSQFSNLGFRLARPSGEVAASGQTANIETVETEQAADSGTETTATATNFTRVIELKSPRMNGPDIVALQKRLLSLGYDSVGEADGYYDPATEGVIKTIQEFSGFEVNGEVNRQLLDYILDNSKETYLKKISTVAKYNINNLILTDKSYDPYAETGGGYPTNDRYYHSSDGDLKIRFYDDGSDGMLGYTIYYLSKDEYIVLVRRLYGDDEVAWRKGSGAWQIENGEMRPKADGFDIESFEVRE
jgi:formylglycine-generating enzyme required for sulfatase activity